MAKLDLAGQISKALEHQVVLATGDEEYARRQFVAGLLQAVCPEDDDFDLAQYDAGSSSGTDWLGAVCIAPFLSSRRTVLVRNLLRCTNIVETFGPKGLVAGAVPPTGLLILVADELGEGKKGSKPNEWEKVVKGVGGFVFAVKADAKTARSLIKDEAEGLGVNLSPKAVDLMAEMVGNSVSRAIEELPKLALYCQGRTATDRDVADLVVPTGDWEVFRLVDAIVEGNLSVALAQIRRLVGSSVKAENAAFQFILPTLRNQFRLLWQARTCLDAKAAPTNAPEAIAASFPTKPNLSTVGEWQRNKALRHARLVSHGSLVDCFEILSSTDAAMKGMGASFSHIESLEQMVLALTSAIRPKIRS